ncbi:MAG: tetratricopeptide repeat protein [Flavobacteriales bacterium]|nr:tetratricopeptide repeat protein [Flavobacteriales bacterium]
MKLKTLIITLLVSISSFASDQLFEKANKAYNNSDYTSAITLYDSILTIGLESSELYYNLGNCHYKAQNWANAIWHYEKSLKLERNDKTIQNLELANLKIIDQIEDIPQLFYKKWWSSFISIFNTFSWQLISILIIWLALTIKILNQFTNYKKEHFLSILYSLALISVFATYSSYQRNITKKEAIIFTSSVVVNSAPTTNSTNLFSLHSGSKIEILDTIGEWINIKIANGNSGWILQNSIKEL